MRILFSTIGLAFLVFANLAQAAELAPATGDVVLMVQGDIQVKNSPDAAQFDMDMLRALPVTEFKTATPWTEGVATFKGVALKDVLERVEAKGANLKAVAINDYAADLPMSDATNNGALLAYELNGALMSVRDKGPLWIIYPFDAKPALKAEEFYSRAVWQLKSIVVVP